MVTAATKPDYDYARYVWQHGTEDEKSALLAETEFMAELRKAFPGSEWQPLESVRLIGHLVTRADTLAARRLDAAKRLKYRDHQGKKGRTLAEEKATVRSQFATQIMLGLPLGKPDTYQEARRVGNCGGGHDSFLPLHNAFSHRLVIKASVPGEIIKWLVLDEGAHTYRLRGWVTAEEGRLIGQHKKDWPRPGSDAWWVHPEGLHSVEEWWASQ